MLYPARASVRRSAPRPSRRLASWGWGRLLLAAGALTIGSLLGAHPTARPYATVAACVLLRGGDAPRPNGTARAVRAARPRVHAPSATSWRHAQRPAPSAPAVSAPQAEMLALINAERAQAGDGPLQFDTTLNAVAQARSQDMIARHYFAHEIPGVPGVHMVFDILDHDNVQYEMAGENIALNNYIDFYPMTKTVQQTNTDLMNSPEHRANLLEPHYTKIGIGLAVEQGTGKLILTEVFVQP
jgi:uncharacterized protein YkwD